MRQSSAKRRIVELTTDGNLANHLYVTGTIRAPAALFPEGHQTGLYPQVTYSLLQFYYNTLNPVYQEGLDPTEN